MDEEAFVKLTKDIKAGVATMTPNEARFLVDAYYQMQENRIRADGQVRSMIDEEEGKDEPHAVLDWISENSAALENQVRSALQAYSQSKPIGRWAESNWGVGPVISAGLIAHIDITKCPTVGHIYSFAGLNPERVWKKGEKRPHNASLKTLCWKMGDCFLKVSGKDDSVYGRLYRERAAYEASKNAAGDYAEQAAKILERVPNHKQKKIYAEGKLSDGHLLSRAKRYAVKIFLSHWWEQAYWFHHGTEPPVPFAIGKLSHAHYIEPEVVIEKKKAA